MRDEEGHPCILRWRHDIAEMLKSNIGRNYRSVAFFRARRRRRQTQRLLADAIKFRTIDYCPSLWRWAVLRREEKFVKSRDMFSFESLGYDLSCISHEGASVWLLDPSTVRNYVSIGLEWSLKVWDLGA